MLYNILKTKAIIALGFILSAYGWLHMISFFFRFKSQGKIEHIGLYFSAWLLILATAQIIIAAVMVSRKRFEAIKNQVGSAADHEK